jgi:hypothetical protein
VKGFRWDEGKNALLASERAITFPEVVSHIEHGDLLDILEQRNPDRYAGPGATCGGILKWRS